MVSGWITQTWQARISVDLMGRDGLFQATEFVLDTGFAGDLLLPSDMLHQLRLRPGPEIIGALADGQEIRLNSWRGAARWHGRIRNILILEAEGEPLLGMNLLRGSRVTLEVTRGGPVTIIEI